MPTTIKYGSQGADVALAQQLLNSFGYQLSIDGDFGTETYNTVVDFQTRSHIAVDGVVGPETWEALNAPLTVSDTQGKQTTGTLSPVPVRGGGAATPKVYNQLAPAGTGTGSGGPGWKLWAILAALSLGAWWILKSGKKEKE